MSNAKLAATFHGVKHRRPSSRQREAALRAQVADLLTDVDHFAGCMAEPDMTNCACLIGRLHWAIGAEEVRT